VDQVLRHHRKATPPAGGNFRRLQPDLIACVVKNDNTLRRILLDNADELPLCLGFQYPDVILRRDSCAWVHDGIEQRVFAQFASYSRKVRSSLLTSADAVARVAFGACTRREHKLAARSISLPS